MKRLITTLCLCGIALMSGISLSAKYRSITVHLKDNSTMSFNITDDFTVRFNDIEMTISSSQLTNVVIIDKSYLSGFEHLTSMAAVEEIESDTQGPVIEGGVMTFANVPNDSSIQVYDLSGRLVKEDTASDTYSLPLATLGSGIYVVKVNSITYKIAVK